MGPFWGGADETHGPIYQKCADTNQAASTQGGTGGEQDPKTGRWWIYEPYQAMRG